MVATGWVKLAMAIKAVVREAYMMVRAAVTTGRVAVATGWVKLAVAMQVAVREETETGRVSVATGWVKLVVAIMAVVATAKNALVETAAEVGWVACFA